MTLRDPKVRVWGAWALLGATLIGWPVSLVMVDEPAVILSLSWLALSLTAVDILATTDVRAKEEEAGE